MEQYTNMDPKKKNIIKIVLGIVVLVVLVHIVGAGFHKSSDLQQDTIVVSGKGEITAKPDLATVSFSVTEDNMDVSKATVAVDTKIKKILEALKTDGIEEKDIKTTGYNIYPKYDYVVYKGGIAPGDSYQYPNGKQTLTGYEVTQSIEVKVHDISKAGKVVADLGFYGATNLYGPNFTNENYDELVLQARDEAIAKAREEAKRLAKALGVRLVKIVAFSENGNYPIMYGRAETMMAKDSSAPSAATLPTGENTITSNVSITYEIR